MHRHKYFMQQAYELAKQAEAEGEVPVAAVIVIDNKIVAHGFNACIQESDPTAHAEIVALRKAGKLLKNYRLINASLYVTLEPCLMCAAAMLHARIKELIFAAYDPKAGAVSSVYETFNHPSLNHQISWKGGVLEAPCNELLKSFFAKRRIRGNDETEWK